MSDQPLMFDHTMRELFEYPDPSIPFIVWTGNFQMFADRAIVCHWHNEFEFGVLLSGESDYYIDGQLLTVREGDAVFINANTMHAAAPTAGYDNAVLFTVSFLPSLFTGGNDGTMFRKYFQPIIHSSVMGFCIEHTTQDGRNIVKLLHELYALEHCRPDDYELLSISLISRIWGLTLRYMKDQKQEFTAFRTDRRKETKAKDILTYIHEHYAEDIKIDDITQHTGISRSECFRCFQQYTNKKPIEYLTEYRLAHAANLLRETDKSITQIATECGFSNSSYFGKIFKQKYAITPSHFKS